MNPQITEARQQLGSFLKSKRLELGMNRTKASELSGLTREQIIHMEAGTRDYTIGSLIRLTDVLGLKIKLELI
jgi:transcriptional regulator with XRE-family HTH domain